MSKYVPIRLSQNDRKEYARLVRNAKAKIRRTKKNYGVDISSKIDIPSIESFSVRKDFKDWKDKAEHFTSRFNAELQFVKNEYGVVATKKQIREIEQNTKIAIKKAKAMVKTLEELPVYIDQKKEMVVKQKMGITASKSVTGINIPKPFDFKEVKDKYSLQAKERGMRVQAKDDALKKKMQVFQQNFIQKVVCDFGDDATEVYEKMDNMSELEFYQMFQMYPESFDYSFYGSCGEDGYGDLGGAETGQLLQLIGDVDHYLENEYGKNDLKYYQ